MGRRFFGVDVQGIVGGILTPGTMPTLYLKKGATSYKTCGNVGAYTIDALAEDKSIQKGDQHIVLVAKLLDAAGVEPVKGDVIVDDKGKNMTIIAATTDSARAVWICQCRG